ncbi:MAG: hypothetical protein HQM15_02250 [Deltaproteobacteria bacterium]|nr:hypothetical protein [Deltaproteobacteria bacterium]
MIPGGACLTTPEPPPPLLSPAPLEESVAGGVFAGGACTIGVVWGGATGAGAGAAVTAAGLLKLEIHSVNADPEFAFWSGFVCAKATLPPPQQPGQAWPLA